MACNEQETSALRNAQADALALLRAVCRRYTRPVTEDNHEHPVREHQQQQQRSNEEKVDEGVHHKEVSILNAGSLDGKGGLEEGDKGDHAVMKTADLGEGGGREGGPSSAPSFTASSHRAHAQHERNCDAVVVLQVRMRYALLKETSILAGLVRCLASVVAFTPTPTSTSVPSTAFTSTSTSTCGPRSTTAAQAPGVTSSDESLQNYDQCLSNGMGHTEGWRVIGGGSRAGVEKNVPPGYAERGIDDMEGNKGRSSRYAGERAICSPVRGTRYAQMLGTHVS